MKRCSIVLLIGAFSSLVLLFDSGPAEPTASAASSRPPARWTLPVRGVSQLTDSWCWAASTQMILNYCGKNVFQPEMANIVTGRKDCGASPIPSACIIGNWAPPILDHFGFTYEFTRVRLTPEEIVQQLFVRRKPFSFSWQWTGGGFHEMVVVGYAQVQGVFLLEILDPAPPVLTDPANPLGGNHFFCTYDKWLADEGHKFAYATYNIEKPKLTPVNLLRNGDFEVGPDVEKFQSLDQGSTAIPDWTVTRAQIDYIVTTWKAAHGERSIDLHGSPGYGGIQQSFKTKKGQRYRVTFAMAGTPKSVSGEGGVKRLAVSAAGRMQEFRFDTTGKSADDMGWLDKSWEFEAAEDETTLEFYTLQTTDPNCGPTLDHVRVVAVAKKR